MGNRYYYFHSHVDECYLDNGELYCVLDAARNFGWLTLFPDPYRTKPCDHPLAEHDGNGCKHCDCKAGKFSALTRPTASSTFSQHNDPGDEDIARAENEGMV